MWVMLPPSQTQNDSPSPRGRIHSSGVMADMVRNFDWANTPVGAIEDWPELLLNTVNTLLSSRQPMFLWWGNDLMQFYNDAYCPCIGADKHPAATEADKAAAIARSESRVSALSGDALLYLGPGATLTESPLSPDLYL